MPTFPSPLEVAHSPAEASRRSGQDLHDRAARTRAVLAATDPLVEPILPGPEGNRAHTDLGRVWQFHIAQQVRTPSRLTRARRFVQHGCVVDLRLSPGRLVGRVQGRELHAVDVRFAEVPPFALRHLRDAALADTDRMLAALTSASEPRWTALLIDPMCGLLPRPTEWSATCTCPHDRDHCVHVLAVLHAFGRRLDVRPDALAQLRSLHIADLLTPESTTSDFSDSELESLFDLTFDPTVTESPPPPVLPALPDLPELTLQSVPVLVQPSARPHPPSAGLIDSTTAALVAAALGARSFPEAEVLLASAPTVWRAIWRGGPPGLGALERLVSHGEPSFWTAALVDFARGSLTSTAPRESVRRRLQRAYAREESPIPHVQLRPTADGGVVVHGKRAPAWIARLGSSATPGDASARLVPRAFDPDRVFAPFVQVADAMLAEFPFRSSGDLRRWQRGSGRTGVGVKALLQMASTAGWPRGDLAGSTRAFFASRAMGPGGQPPDNVQS